MNFRCIVNDGFDARRRNECCYIVTYGGNHNGVESLVTDTVKGKADCGDYG